VKIGPILGGRAEPWHFETFRLAFVPRLYGVSWLNFVTGTDGSPVAVEFDGQRYARRAEESANGED